MTITTMTAGTMFLMWLGDQITERGIGNGVSLIITVGILAQLPPVSFRHGAPLFHLSGCTGQRQPDCAGPPVSVPGPCHCGGHRGDASPAQDQHPVKRVVGRKVYGGQTQYMPLKINYAGVMPIIFAQAILLFPSTIINMAFPKAAPHRKLRISSPSAGSITCSME